MTPKHYETLIRALQESIQSAADPKVKTWFENYLKGEVQYYGVKTPQVRKIVQAWNKKHQLSSWEISAQIDLCKSLMKLPHAEEKFSATIYIQLFLLKKATTEQILETSEYFFTQGYFFDWSTADWYTVRVVAKVLERDISALPRITSWAKSNLVWKRRASIVALRSLSKQAKYLPQIEEVISKLIGDEERFVQTGIGWTLSDVSKKFPLEAQAIVEKYFTKLSLEVIDRHTKYMPKHMEYKKRKRAEKKKEGSLMKTRGNLIINVLGVLLLILPTVLFLVEDRQYWDFYTDIVCF